MFLIDCRWLSFLISPISSFPCFPMPTFPICSMYGIFTNICPKNHPNVVKYTIHGAYGFVSPLRIRSATRRSLDLLFSSGLRNVIGLASVINACGKTQETGWIWFRGSILVIQWDLLWLGCGISMDFLGFGGIFMGIQIKCIAWIGLQNGISWHVVWI